jgi:hypothetical protein
MYLNSCMKTPLFFQLSKMMSLHMLTLLHMRVLIHRISMIQIQSHYNHIQSQCIHMNMKIQSRGPKWAKTTLQDAGDLVGDPSDTRRNRSDLEEPPLALISIELMPPKHLSLVQYSYPYSFSEATRNPFWESTIQEEYNSLLENQTWDMVSLPSRRKLFRCIWVYRTKSAMDG